MSKVVRVRRRRGGQLVRFEQPGPGEVGGLLRVPVSEGWQRALRQRRRKRNGRTR